jgi:hypothetical protein
MRALELLDVQKHFILGDNLQVLKGGLRIADNLEIFAMKVDGTVEEEGVMDDAFEVSRSDLGQGIGIVIDLRFISLSTCPTSVIYPFKPISSL